MDADRSGNIRLLLATRDRGLGYIITGTYKSVT